MRIFQWTVSIHTASFQFQASSTQRRQSVTRSAIDASGSYLDTIMNTAMLKPLPNLPVDVWFYIFQLFNDEYDKYDKRAVISLASVNKFLRDIGLPVLFRTLDLFAPKYIYFETGSCLKRIIQRVRDINASPHVFNVVRRLTLTRWYICPCDDDMSDGSTTESDDYSMDEFNFNLPHYPNRHEIVKFKSDGYREIMALISHLPRLDHLACHHCSFTLESLYLLFCVPNLQSLHLHDHTVMRNDLTQYQLAVTSSSLCVFQYTRARWSDKTSVVEIVIPLIGQLIVASFPLDVLTHILADSNLPITLPKLQKLSTFNVQLENLDNHDDLIHFRNFLSLTPNLSELRIVSDIHMKTPFIIPDTVIPHLKILMAPSYIASCIASGRALEKLHLLVSRPRKIRESYTVVSRDIKHVLYHGALDSPEDLNHLARLFPEASTLEITVRGGCERKKTSDMVLSILPEFRQLKQFTISVTGRFPFEYGSLTVTPYCPIGRVDDPKYRSHPTLEEVQILSFYRWIWCPADGWRSVHSPYGTDVLSTMQLFE